MEAAAEERSSSMSKVLTQIESALQGLARWRGWTDKDRLLVKDVAANIAELNRRYAVRHAVLHREEGSRHVHRP